jgi:hypothetical protein
MARMPAGEVNIIALARFATESAESNAAAAATVKVRLRMTFSLGIVLGASPNGMNQLGTLVSHTCTERAFHQSCPDELRAAGRVAVGVAWDLPTCGGVLGDVNRN